jgi:transcriptional regulator with XRE-family HTH domain
MTQMKERAAAGRERGEPFNARDEGPTIRGERKEGGEMAKKAPNPIDKHVGSRVRMRRMMLGMSQEKLGDALGLTFQQVQKYEKGTNRIGASRLQQISVILQVPVAFFFEGAPHVAASHTTGGMEEAPSPAYVSDFLATSDGLSLTKAFMRIHNPKLRRRIVDLVEEIAGEGPADK